METLKNIKQNSINGHHHLTYRKTILILFFFLFLYPFSLVVSESGVSANYIFLLLPLFYLLINIKLKKPHNLLLMLMGLFTLIFIIASIFQYNFYADGLRRIISFFIFMSIFSYMFIKIDSEMIEAFKISLILIGLYFSILSAYSFFMAGGSSIGFQAKGLVGSNRFGFIYLLGIWLTYFYQTHKKSYFVIKYAILLILLVGLFLTFSRSSIVGLLGSFGIFALVNSLKWFKMPNSKMFLRAFASVIIISCLIILLYQLVPVTFNFFQERLFAFVSDASPLRADIANPQTSEGARLFIAGKILDFLIDNPLNLLTGAGYLGFWVYSDLGSAHSQYTDVLFRTGLLGFIAYFYLLSLLMKHLYRNQKALFWGLVAMLIFGLFNETFKESQGAFVLTFLLGMMSQSFKKKILL